MPRHIDYYFSLVSPWAYIGQKAFMEVVKRHNATLSYKPMALGAVFAETGGLPLAKRAPARQRYRLLELQRWREKRGLNFPLKPRHWPFDAALADRFAIAADKAGHDLAPFLLLAFQAIWEKEQNLADEATILAVAREAGIANAESLLETAKSDAIKEAYEANNKEAIARDAFGSPAYVLDGEVFWGQDRIDLLDDALKSGRKAYKPEG
jgi:2-hydroxychromene-2-carboxylate isomerase